MQKYRMVSGRFELTLVEGQGSADRVTLDHRPPEGLYEDPLSYKTLMILCSIIHQVLHCIVDTVLSLWSILMTDQTILISDFSLFSHTDMYVKIVVK